MKPEKVLILGAAGRDFHNFNVVFRDQPRYQVVGFTAAQIPRIDCRTYPPTLSGRLYPQGLPVWPESELERIIEEMEVQICVLSYSDLGAEAVISIASRVLAAGADFWLLGTDRTMLEAHRPVVAVCGVRTGVGKSQVSRYVVQVLRSWGLKPVVIRHPMPYGNLNRQAVQRFASSYDLSAAEATIEEREEYEAHINNGTVVYAGVDYQSILRQAEREGQVIVWDGGNNDLPFLHPDLWITVADGMRPGQETGYYPGETNFRSADVIVINKAQSADLASIGIIRNNAARLNPQATVVLAASAVIVERPELIRGKRVLVIEDGPTITHGGMAYGAGLVAARSHSAAEIVDPRPFASGTLRGVYDSYPHIGPVLPAVGYFPDQIRDLEETVRRAECDTVVVATPVDLRQVIALDRPSTRVYYDMQDMGEPTLRDTMEERLRNRLDLAGARPSASASPSNSDVSPPGGGWS